MFFFSDLKIIVHGTHRLLCLGDPTFTDQRQVGYTGTQGEILWLPLVSPISYWCRFLKQLFESRAGFLRLLVS